ncbi:MAG: type I 3-dehydroquinate dehydratase [Dehalococcoidales bacterium]|nr:type I 3-dehydroquinate dehydratase [Dehalococcoidales bacterium]
MKPRICASIVANDIPAIKEVAPLVDLFELRIDLVGKGWPELAGQLAKPWIACNRTAGEGGNWQGSEAKRIEALLQALGLGASIVDIELNTLGLPEIVKKIKKQAKCLISYHDLKATPSPEKMRQIIQRQLEAGADICKLVATATKSEDNLAMLQLIKDFPDNRVVSFVMGPMGQVSRVFCPLVGGDFTYGSISAGRESAPGQLTVQNLRKIYEMLKYD